MTQQELFSIKEYARNLGYEIQDEKDTWSDPNMFCVKFPNTTEFNIVIDCTWGKNDVGKFDKLDIAGYTRELYLPEEFAAPENTFDVESLSLTSVQNMLKQYMELSKEDRINSKLNELDKDFEE